MAYYYRGGYTYTQHLQNNAYINDIKKSMVPFAGIGNKFAKSIDQQTKKLIAGNSTLTKYYGSSFDSFQNTLDLTNWSIKNGLAQLKESVEGIENAIVKLGAGFEHAIGMMIDQQKYTNELLMEIVNLLSLPDSEKQRRHLINLAVERYKSGLFPESLDSFLKALNYDETDHNLLFRIGSIYLNCYEVVNVKRARDYFRKAQKYSAARGKNCFASICALNSAYSNYILISDKEAIQDCRDAVLLNPNLSEAYFLAAKLYCLDNNPKNVEQTLRTAIINDRHYCLKAVVDSDFDNTRQIVDFLFRKLKDESRKEVNNNKTIYDRILNIFNNLNSIEQNILDPNNEIRKLLIEIKSLYVNDTYFDNLDVLSKLQALKSQYTEMVRRINE